MLLGTDESKAGLETANSPMLLDDVPYKLSSMKILPQSPYKRIIYPC